MGIKEQVEKALASEKALQQIQPDLLRPHRVKNLWRLTWLRAGQSIDPRLDIRLRNSSRSEVVKLATRAVYGTIELMKKRRG